MHFRDMQEQDTFHAGREYERKILTKRIEELEEDYADLKKVQTADYNHAVRNAERIKKLEIDSQVDDEDGHHFGYLLGPCRD